MSSPSSSQSPRVPDEDTLVGCQWPQGGSRFCERPQLFWDPARDTIFWATLQISLQGGAEGGIVNVCLYVCSPKKADKEEARDLNRDWVIGHMRVAFFAALFTGVMGGILGLYFKGYIST